MVEKYKIRQCDKLLCILKNDKTSDFYQSDYNNI